MSARFDEALLGPLLRKIDDLDKRQKRLEALDLTPAWTAFTPVVTQSGDVTFGGGSFGYYWVYGNRVEVAIYCDITGSGTTGNSIVISGFPSAIYAVDSGRWVYGSAQIWDASAGEYHVGNAVASGDAIAIQIDGTQDEWHTAGVFPNFPLGSGDRIAIRASWRI